LKHRSRDQQAEVALAEESTSPASASSQTASALHRFNRYEIKYFLQETNVPALRERLQERMATDSHQIENGPARVSSLYYDSRDLRCYWEKIEGLRFRRKLRIRVYGEPETVNDDSTVFVEIKQRVNRVTQKRRIPMTYAQARRLCDERVDPQVSGAKQTFVDEVLSFIDLIDLQPTAITTYRREAYLGTDADTGVRVTIDHRVSGRNKDFYLGTLNATNSFIIPSHLAVVELKANERVPSWFTDLAAELNLNTVRISKYCQAIESHQMAPRTPQHVRKFPEPA
jgi:SPX domain protein involved in polyphosphate accumulation